MLVNILESLAAIYERFNLFLTRAFLIAMSLKASLNFTRKLLTGWLWVLWTVIFRHTSKKTIYYHESSL